MTCAIEAFDEGKSTLSHNPLWQLTNRSQPLKCASPSVLRPTVCKVTIAFRRMHAF